MDQYISIFGKKDHALLIDCRDLSCETVPLPLKDYSIVICDSRTSRELAGSVYNRRRAECEEGVRLLSGFYPSVKSLRDITLEEFKSFEERLPDLIKRRCRHVISENGRVMKSVEALKKGDLDYFGKLMTESHKSLRYDYEVSSDCLDCLVNAALEGRECVGSRLTGAGFGGCTVSLVKSDEFLVFKSRVTEVYREKMGKTPDIYISRACDGAMVLCL
jgi:galactokinase